MKKQLMIGATVAAVGAAGMLAFGSVSASPQGMGMDGEANRGFGYERSLETKAQVLDMDKEQLRTQLQDKTFLQLAEDKGLTHEQIQEQMQANAQERWEQMGLSEEEQAERMQRMEQRHAEHEEGEGGEQHQYRHGHRE